MKSAKKVLILHGPNLNLLGDREVHLYGRTTLAALNAALKKKGARLRLAVQTKQTNSEGELIDIIQKSSKSKDALIINPGAYTHTSVAIRDALASLRIPKIEVHLTNIYAREAFRRRSYVSPVVHGTISGFGVESYLLALEAVAVLLSQVSGDKEGTK